MYASLLVFSVVILTGIAQSTVIERTFYGGNKSFAKFEYMMSKEYGKISFQFKTTEKNGMLFYADDNKQLRGIGNYIKIILEDGEMKTQVQISFKKDQEMETRTKLVLLGKGLSDDVYHTVNIYWEKRDFFVKLDAEEKTLTTPLQATMNINSFVFIGGLPMKYRGSVDNRLRGRER